MNTPSQRCHNSLVQPLMGKAPKPCYQWGETCCSRKDGDTTERRGLTDQRKQVQSTTGQSRTYCPVDRHFCKDPPIIESRKSELTDWGEVQCHPAHMRWLLKRDKKSNGTGHMSQQIQHLEGAYSDNQWMQRHRTTQRSTGREETLQKDSWQDLEISDRETESSLMMFGFNRWRSQRLCNQFSLWEKQYSHLDRSY